MKRLIFIPRAKAKSLGKDTYFIGGSIDIEIPDDWEDCSDFVSSDHEKIYHALYDFGTWEVM